MSSKLKSVFYVSAGGYGLQDCFSIHQIIKKGKTRNNEHLLRYIFTTTNTIIQNTILLSTWNDSSAKIIKNKYPNHVKGNSANLSQKKL